MQNIIHLNSIPIYHEIIKEFDRMPLLTGVCNELNKLKPEEYLNSTFFGDNDITVDQVHLLKEFKWLNEHVKNSCLFYLKRLMYYNTNPFTTSEYFKDEEPNIDPIIEGFEDIDLYIQKSWIVSVPNKGSVCEHDHNNSHISVVFYLDVPENSSPLILNQENTFPSLPFLNNIIKTKLEPEVGSLVMFPSFIKHSVEESYHEGFRICVTYDIVIVSKKNKEGYVTDPISWKKIT